MTLHLELMNTEIEELLYGEPDEEEDYWLGEKSLTEVITDGSNLVGSR